MRTLTEIPVDMIEFGAPTTDLDLDGMPITTSVKCYKKDNCLLVIEEYNCWIKVQLSIESSVL